MKGECFLKFKSYHLLVLLGLAYVTTSNDVRAQVKLNKVVVYDIIKSLPTSQEIYLLIKQEKYPFNKKNHKVKKSHKPMTSSGLQALRLGMISSKVLYTEMFNERKKAREYLSKMKACMDSLRLKTISSYKSLYAYINKSKDLDYLAFRTGAYIEQIKDNCFNQGKIDQLVLIYTGDWIESMQLLVTETLKKQNVNLKHRILEQDLIIEQLLMLYQSLDQKELIKQVQLGIVKMKMIIQKAKKINDNGEFIYSKLSRRKLKKMRKAIKTITLRVR